MIWLIGCKGMLGMEIARQLTENNMEFAGTGRDVDVTSAQELADFAKGKNKFNDGTTVGYSVKVSNISGDVATVVITKN